MPVRKTAKKTVTRKPRTSKKTVMRKPRTSKKTVTRKPRTSKKTVTRKPRTSKKTTQHRRIRRYGGGIDTSQYVIPNSFRLTNASTYSNVERITDTYFNQLTTLSNRLYNSSIIPKLNEQNPTNDEYYAGYYYNYLMPIFDSYIANDASLLNDLPLISFDNLNKLSICGILYQLLMKRPTQYVQGYGIFSVLYEVTRILNDKYGTIPSLISIFRDIMINCVIGVEIFEESILRLEDIQNPIDFFNKYFKDLPIYEIFRFLRGMVKEKNFSNK